MNQQRKRRLAMGALAVTLSAALAHVPASADEPARHTQHPTGCGAYDIDISAELRMLGETGAPAAASATKADSGAVIAIRTVYLLALKPQPSVALAVPPRRHVLEEGAHAGMVSFEVPQDGTWRVSLDKETWVEVVGPDGLAVKSSRFQGREGCPPMRKLVEFPLEGDTLYTLQLSGGVDAQIKVLVTGPIADTD